MSTDPPIEPETWLKLDFARPSDGQPTSATGRVVELLSDGGLWRGRPAALVEFDEPIDLDETLPPFESKRFERRARTDLGGTDAPLPRRPAVGESPPPALGSALHPTGLGRRHRNPIRLSTRTAQQQARTHPSAPPPGPPQAPDPFGPAGGPFWADDEATAPPTHRVRDVPDLAAATGDAFDPFFASDEATVPERKADQEPGADGDGEFSTDMFLGSFGRVQDVPAHSLPPGAWGEEEEDRSEQGVEDLPDSSLSFSVPASPIPQRQVPPTSGQPAAGPGGRPGSTASDQPPRQTAVPPIQVTLDSRDSGAGAHPPWEGAKADPNAASLIPRGARIASTLPVHFWARGRQQPAIAQNFSRAGLFLGASGTPPVRGAIVRVEFPIQGAEEAVPVRFNAEVRWHRADRPGAGLPDGFGVQILTFETPKDRARYEEILTAILTLGADREPASVTSEFQWGKPSGRLG